MILRFTHVFAFISSAFLFKIIILFHCWVVFRCIDYITLVDKQLDGFQYRLLRMKLVKTFFYKSLYGPLFHFSYVNVYEISGYEGRCIFNCQTVFQSSCTLSHPTNNLWESTFSTSSLTFVFPVFLIVPLLVGMECYFIMILISISLMIKTVVHLLMTNASLKAHRIVYKFNQMNSKLKSDGFISLLRLKCFCREVGIF